MNPFRLPPSAFILRKGRQPYFELAARSRSAAARRYLSAVELHQALHQRQADANAPGGARQGLVSLREQVEHPRQQLPRHSDPRVADADNSSGGWRGEGGG